MKQLWKVQNNQIQETTLEEILEYLDPLPRVGLDIETTRLTGTYGKQEGLDPYLSKLVMVQVGDLNTQFVIDARFCFEEGKQVIEHIKEKEIVGHNLSFEIRHLYHKYDIWLEHNLKDTFVIEQLLTAGYYKPHRSLKAVTAKYTTLPISKETRESFLTVGVKPFTVSQILYGAQDVVAPLHVLERQLSWIKQYELEHLLELEMDFLPVLAHVEYTGIYLDKQKWVSLYEKNQKEYIAREKQLNDYTINLLKSPSYSHLRKYIIQGLFDPDQLAISWRSSKQVCELFDNLGIDILVKDKEKSKKHKKLVYKQSVEAKVIGKHKKDWPIVDMYLKLKESEQKVTTFGLKFLDNINPITGRIHPSFDQNKNTGRLSTKPNLQNIPGSSEFRGCFVSQNPTGVMKAADYSQQEPRITADKCGEKSLIDFYINGDGDSHSFVTNKLYSVILGREVTEVTKANPYIKEMGDTNVRQLGKILNLKLDYGGSAYSVKDDLGKTEEEAQSFIDALKAAFPGKEAYFNKVTKDAFHNNYILIDPITKRKVFSEDFSLVKHLESIPLEDQEEGHFSFYMTVKSSLERNCKNYPIQGTAASMTKLAVINIYKKLKDKGWLDKAKIVNIIHDEVLLEVDKSISEEVTVIVETEMEKAGKVFCKEVPMIAKAIDSDHWEH